MICLKEVMSSAPVLTISMQKDQLILQMDASDIGIGAVLGVLHV